MTDKLVLKSSHEVIYTVDVADVESIFYCKPTDPDILTVLMKDGKRLYCDEVCPIDSLQENPVCAFSTNRLNLSNVERTVKDWKEMPVSEDLEEASKEWLRPQLDKSYDNYGEAKMMELTHFDGYAMLDAVEFGAKWQKEQMMANAIDGDITFDYYGDDDKTYGCIAHNSFCLEDLGLKDRDKVKMILIKED